jgi:colicin import membrane protein
MPSKKTPSVKKHAAKAKPAAKKAAPKAKVQAKPKAPPAKVLPRHPKARVAEGHGSKAALAKAIAPLLARTDEDAGALEGRLKKASNAQLIRLQRATQTLKAKYGNREKLIAAIGEAQRKAKDKDYLAKLDTYSLPQLLDLAAAGA